MNSNIHWDEKYSIGVAQIDKQHMHLIELLNRMSNACESISENTENVFIEVMKESTEYVLTHFRDEEKLMHIINYCNFLEHKVLHEQFIKKNLRDNKGI